MEGVQEVQGSPMAVYIWGNGGVSAGIAAAAASVSPAKSAKKELNTEKVAAGREALLKRVAVAKVHDGVAAFEEQQTKQRAIIWNEQTATFSELVAAKDLAARSFKKAQTSRDILSSMTFEGEDIKGWVLRYVLQVKCMGEDLTAAPIIISGVIAPDAEDYTTLEGLKELAQDDSVGSIDPKELFMLVNTDPKYLMGCIERSQAYLVRTTPQLSEHADFYRAALVELLLQRFTELDHKQLKGHLTTLSAASFRQLFPQLSEPLGSRILTCLSSLPPSADVTGILRHVVSSDVTSFAGLMEQELHHPSISYTLTSVVSRFLAVPSLKDLHQVLDSIPKYPQVHDVEIVSSMTAPRKLSSAAIDDVCTVLICLLKNTSARPLAVQWCQKYLAAHLSRVEYDANKLDRVPVRIDEETMYMKVAVLMYALAAPACEGDKVDMNYIRSIQCIEEHTEWEDEERGDPEWCDDVDVREEGFNFSTTMFFLCMSCLRCLTMPCMRVYKKLRENYYKALSQAIEQNGGAQAYGNMNLPPQIIQMAKMLDAYRFSFLSPQSIELTTKITTTALGLLSKDEKALKAMPVCLLGDIVTWLEFVSHESPDRLVSLENINNIIGFLVQLSIGDIFRKHTLLKAKILGFISSLQPKNRHTGDTATQYSDVWNARLFSQHESPISLFSVIEKSSFVRDIPVLIFQVYAGLERAGGYDIKKDEAVFSSAKVQSIELLRSLMIKDRFKEGLIACLNKEGGNDDVVDFLSSLVTGAIHQLDDSLLRLTEVNDLEKFVNDKRLAATRNQFQAMQDKHKLEHQRRAAKGFMSGAMGACRVLQMLLNPLNIPVPEPFAALLSRPVLKTLSHYVVHFLNRLFSKTCDDLRTLYKPSELNYDFHGILEVCINIIVLMKGHPVFQESYREHPDYSREVLGKALQDIERAALGGMRFLKGLQEFIDNLDTAESSVLETAVAGEVDLWQPSGELRVDEDRFAEALEDNQFESCDFDDYKTHAMWREIAEMGGSVVPEKRKALMKDMKLMRQFPLLPAASVFCVNDESRMDVMRIILSGPQGTPYSHGLFIFDVICSDTYPKNPPNFLLRTTGEGTIRMSPNLYESGKVCLSLLNTWHGDDDSMRWNSGSSLYQVALSIQSAILVPDPYFGEPGNEASQNTPEGQRYSREYNQERRLATLRVSILSNLRSPPKGCENLIRKYYSELQDQVMLNARTWYEEADGPVKPKFATAMAALAEEFSKLPKSTCCTWA